MSQHIKILPEKLCNQIAAGEVVERPSSVVKELVENSLDAGADKIVIEVERGGKKRIVVADNGHGMGSDDIFLCFERHATSKISSEEDLFNLHYLGFRGEALPSIAAVSRLVVTSRREADETGSRLSVNAGKVINCQQVGVTTGTTFEINGLFFNLPARRKFLRRDETEFSHIAEVVTRLALAHPQVHFKLVHNGRAVMDLYRHKTSFDRVAAILGRSVIPEMVAVDSGDARLGLSGFIARPTVSRSTTNAIYCFVNGRFVKDRVLHHAIMAGYRHLLMKGRYPVCVLFVQLDSQMVDVNVHPTKHEVRFHDQQNVHNFVSNAVRERLRHLEADGRQGSMDSDVAVDMDRQQQTVKTHLSAIAPPPAVRNRQEDNITDGITDGATAAQLLPKGNGEAGVAETGRDYLPSSAPTEVETASPPEAVLPFGEDGYFSSLVIIGQYHNSYIVCEDEQGLVLIDQHAAHERIGFERLKQQFNLGCVEQQELLFPVVIELSVREDTELRQCQELFQRLGYDLQPFGGTSWALTSIPTYVHENDLKALICDILTELNALGVSETSRDAFDAVLITMACHGMIRANQKLGMVEMRALLQQLDEVEFNRQCPHGRPVLQRLSLPVIEKMFRRI